VNGPHRGWIEYGAPRFALGAPYAVLGVKYFIKLRIENFNVIYRHVENMGKNSWGRSQIIYNLIKINPPLIDAY
jgi:hypothetical protein